MPDLLHPMGTTRPQASYPYPQGMPTYEAAPIGQYEPDANAPELRLKLMDGVSQVPQPRNPDYHLTVQRGFPFDR